MSSAITVVDVIVHDNPAGFCDGFKLEVKYESAAFLEDGLEWDLVYVGSAESKKYDQVLASIVIGPVAKGRHQFMLEANSPDASKIPISDILEPTILLLIGSYQKEEFIRICWIVVNEYNDAKLREEPPAIPIIEKVYLILL
ncbi:unnamed protein product [Dracunculus medinensis]|uniref:Histone chaperone ASF1 n=1 Tax=Dracunculus medinensis TaxID=318479 RepID=A0A0N4UE74_DRAME|nr:unnamed protein product [Dracunculus medinensis]